MFGKLKIGLEYVLRRAGPMSMAPSQLGIFAMSAGSGSKKQFKKDLKDNKDKLKDNKKKEEKLKKEKKVIKKKI